MSFYIVTCTRCLQGRNTRPDNPRAFGVTDLTLTLKFRESCTRSSLTPRSWSPVPKPLLWTFLFVPGPDSLLLKLLTRDISEAFGSHHLLHTLCLEVPVSSRGPRVAPRPNSRVSDDGWLRTDFIKHLPDRLHPCLPEVLGR